MSWGAIGGAAIGTAGSYFSQKSGQAPGFGGGMDFANKATRQPMLDTLEDIESIYGQPAINPLMQQGFDAGSNLMQTLQPYMDYGNQMLGASGAAMEGAMGGANQLMGFDPTQFNQTFQGTGAVGPQFDQNAYGQAFGNYSSAIQPMLQSIGTMNADALNRNALPNMTAQAIASGSTAGSKVPINSALLAGETAKANANAAAQMYAQGAQQGNQIGAQYGTEMADAMNRAMLQNSSLGNQLNFQQSGQNMQAKLQSLGMATDAYGNVMQQTAPYWSDMINLQTKLPSLLTLLGTQQRNAPADWLQMQQDAIGVVGNFGTGGAAGAPGGGGYNYGQMLLGGLQGAGIGNWAQDQWGGGDGGYDQYNVPTGRNTNPDGTIFM